MAKLVSSARANPILQNSPAKSIELKILALIETLILSIAECRAEIQPETFRFQDFFLLCVAFALIMPVGDIFMICHN
jgi:hypothetical protein